MITWNMLVMSVFLSYWLGVFMGKTYPKIERKVRKQR